MKILMLTQYYPPEVGAPQFRLSDMAGRLHKLGNSVIIMTAMPNYPQMLVHEKYRGKFYSKEIINGIEVNRSWIYANQRRSFGSRIISYFSFLITSIIVGIFVLPRADILICESPPLFLGISAWLLSKLKRAKLVFNVSDLWPESAVKLDLVKSKALISISEQLERFMYRHSLLVTGQTMGICDNIMARFPEVPTYWWRNGIDIDGFSTSADRQKARKELGFNADDFVLVYAGIHGHAQGLEIILEAAKLLHESRVKFFLVGDGPEKQRIMLMSMEMGLSNVFFHEVVSRSCMSEVLAAADASVIPLRRIDLFKGAIPSKIFESLIMRKPLLLGVDGEARELFIEKGKCGLFFKPEDAGDLAEKAIYLLEHSDAYTQFAGNAFNYVVTNFSREEIAKELIEKIEQQIHAAKR